MANIYATTALKLSDTYVNTLPYNNCSTAAATAAKEVDVGDFALETGATVNVKFGNTNTASNPTLNVSSTGAKSIYYAGKQIADDFLLAGIVYTFIYDGTNWCAINNPYVTAGQKSGTTLGTNATAEGSGNTASGNYSHAEGYYTTASGTYSHAEGYYTKASGNYSHAECRQTSALGMNSHAECYKTYAIGPNSHTEGLYTIANGNSAHAEGFGNTDNYNTVLQAKENSLTAVKTIYDAWSSSPFTCAWGDGSHVEGSCCLALGNYSHAEGYATCAGSWDNTGNTGSGDSYIYDATGHYAHADGYHTEAKGNYSHASGYYTVAKDYQYVIGYYNTDANNSLGSPAPSLPSTGNTSSRTGSAFIIGNGYGPTDYGAGRSNAFRVMYNGNAYTYNASGKYNTNGADYAEYFEWLDANQNNEDRRGYFVTMEGKKIKLASPGDYVLGIISGHPAIVGNSDESWCGRYILDEFGTAVTEEFEYEEKVFDKETHEEKTVLITGIRHKQNPDYDPTKPYIQREDRPEWDAVGMVGVLAVRDDGTCQVNGFCTVAEGGIATASEQGYRVIERVNDHVVKVVFR